MATFPHKTATASQIEAKARELVGRQLIDLQPNLAPMVPSSPQTKGVVGMLYEACFGILPNSMAGPDFVGAAIELKSVPVLVRGSEARAKERISVAMIDFTALAMETWDTATVRRKLGQMLLIFYGWEPLQPIARFRTLAAGIWTPDAVTLEAIKSDWQTIQGLVVNGRRDEVSESLTSVLGAATKGPGHGSKSRAWSLKQPFVTWIYRTMIGQESATTLKPVVDPAAQFEHAILVQLAPYVGQSFGVLARASGREGMGGKSASAAIVRSLVGERSSGRHGDFERFGIEVKTVPVNRLGTVVESMSFPAFVHEELVFETWETSDLLGRLNRLLIVPIHREKKAGLAEMRLGRPFFWNPAANDLDAIGREWERYRALIADRRAAELPPASATTYTHVRPHSRTASDTDPAPGGMDVTKKSFWLNQSYVERILAEHDALTEPRR